MLVSSGVELFGIPGSHKGRDFHVLVVGVLEEKPSDRPKRLERFPVGGFASVIDASGNDFRIGLVSVNLERETELHSGGHFFLLRERGLESRLLRGLEGPKPMGCLVDKAETDDEG